MEQVKKFMVGENVDEVRHSEMPEYAELTKNAGDQPDELHTIRVTGKNGTSEDLTVPQSEMEDFKKAAAGNGDTYEKIINLEMKDGTRKSMTPLEVSRFLRSKEFKASQDHKEAEQGSVALAGAKGAVTGFISGYWGGLKANTSKVVKALPEVALGAEEALGHIINVMPNGGVGDWLVNNSKGYRDYLDAIMPSETKEYLGYEDWSTAVNDFVGNAEALAVKFAPGGGGTLASKLFLETVFQSDAINAFANIYDLSKNGYVAENGEVYGGGKSEIEALSAAGTAYLLNYFGAKTMMKAGGLGETVTKNPLLKFLIGGSAVADVMGTQAAGNKAIENYAMGEEVSNGTLDAFLDGSIEGWLFHGFNAAPGFVIQSATSRADYRRHEQMAREIILSKTETPEGIFELNAMMPKTRELDEALTARKNGEVNTKGVAQAAGLPKTMSQAEINRTLDAINTARQIQAEMNRARMDEVQATALAEEIAKVSEDARVVERIWLKAVEKITDARDLDDPEIREKLVKVAAKEVSNEMSAERENFLAENSRIRGAKISEQMSELEKRGIETWEDAEAADLISRDKYGRYTGGMKAALNVALHGSEELKNAVKNDQLGAEAAEELVTMAYTELGGVPENERKMIMDSIVRRAEGDERVLRRIMRKISDAKESRVDIDKLADEAIGEVNTGAFDSEEAMPGMKIPETPYEGAISAERMKGTELKSRDGGVLGCERFPKVTVEISSEGITVTGLTDEILSKPENQADVAALIKRINDIAEKGDMAVDLGDANAKTVVDAICDEINRGGLEQTQRKMEIRSRLFEVLNESMLGTGVTYDEASFKKALEETGNRRFVDNHGNIYGFVDGEGVIHFNPAAINYNTPIHEYGHLALESIKKINNPLWKRGMELIKDSDYYREIKDNSEMEGSEYSYIRGREEDIRDEALASLIGDRGERLISEKGMGEKLAEWLRDFWAAFKKAIGVADLTEDMIESMTLGEFIDAINAELLKGREFGKKKAKPLSKQSVKTYDEADDSGSNGVLR